MSEKLDALVSLVALLVLLAIVGLFWVVGSKISSSFTAHTEQVQVAKS